MSYDSYSLTTRIPPEKTTRDLIECFDKWREAEFMHARNLRDGWNTAEVLFEYKGKPVRIHYGQQGYYKDNLRAIFLTVDALRMSYKRGLGDILTDTVSQMLQLGAGAFERDPYEVLGVRPDAPIEIIEASYKAMAKRAHPDAGGSDEQMAEVNKAREKILAERQG